MQNLLNAFKKYFDWIAGYSSIIGLPISLISIFIAIYKDWQATYIVTIIIFSFVIISLVLLNVYITRKYYIFFQESSNCVENVNKLDNENSSIKKRIDSLIKRDKDIAQVFHNIFHENRKIVYKINDALFNKKFENYNSIIKSFDKFSLFMINNIKEIFDL